MTFQIEMPSDVREYLTNALIGSEVVDLGLRIVGLCGDPGTTAMTFEAKNRFGKPCAVKFVPRECYGDHSPFGEIARLADADTRHLVVPEDYGDVELPINGTQRSFLWFKSRLVRGETLEEFLNTNRSFSISDEVSRFIQHLHIALDQLERLGLNHGDLHARNIMREIAGADGPNPEIRYVVIDFSETYLQEKPRSGSVRDVEMLGKHLRKFYDVISQREILSRPDESILQAISKLPGQTRTKEVEQGVLLSAEDVRKRFFEALALLERRPRTLKTPFEARSAEYIANDSLLVDLCQISSRVREHLQSNSNVVLVGPRGCGKSMLFRRFRLLTKISASKDKQDVLEEILNDSYVGFYLPCEALFWLRFSELTDSDVNSFKDALQLYFNMAVFSEVASAIDGLPKEIGLVPHDVRRRVREILKSELGVLWETLNCENTSNTWAEMAALAEFSMRRIRQSIAERKLPPITASPDFVTQLVETLREGIPAFSGRYFIFFLDDYTEERVPVALQEVLDPVLIQRCPHLCFKISAHMFGSIYTSFRKAAPDEWRNFTPYNLGSHYLDRPKEEKTVLLDILNKRMEHCEGYEGPIEDWLGHSSYPGDRSLSYALYDPNTRRIAYYHGVDCLIDICTGDFSEIIRLAHEMFQDADITAGDRKKLIPPERQHETIVRFVREHIAGVRHIIPNGQNMFEIVRAFGTLSHKFLTTKALVKKGENSKGKARLEPYRVLTVYIEDLTSATPGALTLWKALQKASVFVGVGQAPSQRTLLADRATMRRLFCPVFKIPFSESEHLPLSRERFEFWMDSPTEFKKLILKEKLESVGQDTLFEKVSVEDGVDTPEEAWYEPQVYPTDSVKIEWSKDFPPQWDEAVNELPQLQPLKNAVCCGDSYDLYIGAMGFEERTTSVIQKLVEKGVTIPNVLLLEVGMYPKATQRRRPSYYEAVASLTGGKPPLPVTTPVDHSDPRFPERFSEMLESIVGSNPRIAFDCTSCPSLVLSQSLAVLLQLKSNLTLFYTESERLFPTREEWERESTKGHISPRYLPFSDDVRFVATPPVLQADDAGELPVLLVLFPTFSTERTRGVLKQSELHPAKRVWIFGEPHYVTANGYQLEMAKQLASPLIYAEDEWGIVNRFDYRNTLLALGSIYAKYRLFYRIVIMPHGSKMQTLGVALFRQAHQVSCAFAMPQRYDPARYSQGVKCSWFLELGNTLALAERLRANRVLGNA